MPLGLDTSRALRSNTQLEALVQAIVAAPTSEPETDVVEWKGQYDLRGNPGHKFGAGRHGMREKASTLPRRLRPA